MICMSAIAPKGIFEDEDIFVCHFAADEADAVYDDYSIPDEAA